MNFKLTKEHVKEAIESTPKFTFLKKIVEDIKVAEANSETVYVLHKNRDHKKADEIQFQKKNVKRTREQMESESDNQEYEYNGGLSYV